MAQKYTGWHRENIKAEIRKKFGSFSAFGATLGLKKASISAVLHRSNASVRVERAIASALELNPHEIWPDRWRTDDTPILPRLKVKHPKGGIPHE
ncbi:MAG: hypothetical protein B7Z57_11710 [Acidiphilium sp. 37-60-79]|nr:MAG: hypothetical protein B7Z57_11710 [Acidiphilium sp. 37-60-79]OZB40879.1 MAG: hypothetical protein B7X48_03380 [Acidiphilium sp. 34-60-192]